MLSVSFPAKTKFAQPIATQVEIESTPLPFKVLLAIGLVGALLAALAIVLTISASRANANHEFWNAMSAPENDDRAYVMGKVFSGIAQRVNVVILGTSSAREALRTDQELNRQLQAKHNVSLTVSNLSTSAQSPIESLLIVDALQPRPGQLVLLHIGLSSLKNPNPFEGIEEGDFMYAPDEIIDKYSTKNIFPSYWNTVSNRTLYYVRAARQTLYRMLNFRLKSWIGQQIYGEVRPNYNPYLYLSQPSHNPREKLRQINSFASDGARHLHANAVYVKNTLVVLAEYLRTRKSRFVIVVTPEMPGEMSKLFPNESRVFNEILDSLQKIHGVERVDLNKEIRWDSSDFYDLTHVNESGRAKWSYAIAEWLSQQSLGMGR